MDKFKEIEARNYECEAGKLENNLTYLEIKTEFERMQFCIIEQQQKEIERLQDIEKAYEAMRKARNHTRN